MDYINEVADERAYRIKALTVVMEAALLFLVCLAGLVCNLLSFFVIVRHPLFNNSFGYLTAYHAASNAIVLLIFILWAVPWTVWSIPDELSGVINHRIGQLLCFLMEVAFHCCLFISANRFVAITFPLRYTYIFTTKVTVLIVIFVSGISVAICLIYFEDGCELYYDHELSGWASGNSSRCEQLMFYIDVGYNVSLFVVVGIVDLITITQLRKMKKIALPNRGEVDSIRSKYSTKKQKKDFQFFFQAILNFCVYASMLVCFHVIAPAAATDFLLFLCTTFAWGFAHAAGGLILVVFNPEVRRHLYSVRYLTKPKEHQLPTIKVKESRQQSLGTSSK
ncbi:hypothetical protein Q1695_012096 [Nippostrongylus brasiliensis]|nr:hypothetical protein Q1695_012096 [Nippostrongylus brasiliensis]